MNPRPVLAVNCGSSSLRLGWFATAECSARVTVERIGGRARMETRRPAGSQTIEVDAKDHRQAFELAIAQLPGSPSAEGLAVGHRIVHAGAEARETTPIDARVTAAIRAQLDLVPLHNGPALEAIAAAAAVFGPRTPQIAVLDTQFHRNLPAHAAHFALPSELAAKHDFRRVGLHGLAHRSMSESHARVGGPRGAEASLVTLQLGNGCSAAAIRAGRSLEVTMGYSPLEGLMMGTRSGDVDPALVARLAALEGVSASVVETWLHTRSGLLGVSARSHDMRDLLAAEKAGDARSALAVAMFVHRVRKSVGAMLAVLGGADAIVFGGAMGERSAAIRARVCAGFEWCGLVLDPEANARVSGSAGRISRDDSKLHAWVIPVDEEALIVREVRRVCAES